MINNSVIKSYKKTKLSFFTTIVRYILLTAFSFIVAFPLIWMIISSLKTKDEMWHFPPSLLPAVAQWGNYADVLKSAPFGLYIFNSSFTAIVIVAIQLVNSALIAYAFTQLKFRGRNILFFIVMITYMLPAAATYVPSYILLAKMNMLDTYKGIIISNAVSVFGIFLIRQEFMQVRKELIEAGKIDGAGHLRILVQIVVPQCKGAFVTLGLISFISNYNNYLWPSLIIKDPKLYLVPIGLRQFFIEGGAYGIKWPQVMAASTITVLPLLILFLVAQKWFMQSVGDTGVKG